MKTFLIFILTFSLIGTAHGAAANTVDLIWEGETSAPVFYAGRPLPTAGNLVRVVAIPTVSQNGRQLVSSQLTFRWVKDRNPIQSASGRGKDVLEYRADRDGVSSIISVEVLNNQGESLTEARVTIPTTSPKIVLFTPRQLTNPTRARGLTGLIPIGPAETTLFAEAFGFSPLELADRRVTFNWRVAGASAPAQREDPRFFTVVAPNQGEGKVELSVTARGESNPAQQIANQTITLGFGLSEFNF
ncbi:MAG: hypothetical protein V1704_02200 [Candidatus Vogelbacteria bacterium]